MIENFRAHVLHIVAKILLVSVVNLESWRNFYKIFKKQVLSQFEGAK